MDGQEVAGTDAQTIHAPVQLPAPLGRTVALLGVALVGSIALTVWFERAGSTSYTGRLQSHVTELTAGDEARLSQWLVAEGEQVEPGKQVAVLIDEKVAARQAALLATAASLEGEIAQLRSQAEIDLAWRMESIDKEILETKLKVAGYLKDQFDQQMEQQGLQQLIENGDEGLFDGTIVTTSAVGASSSDENPLRAILRKESARNAEEVAQVQMKLCERRIEQLGALKNELPAKIESALGIDVAAAKLQSVNAELGVIEQQSAEQSLTSTAYGVVGVFRKQPGERVRAGETLVDILDTDRTYLSVHIPSRDLPLIAVDTELALEFPGGVNRLGKVRAIPPQTDKFANGAATDVEIFVDPIDKLWPAVPVGSEVTVRIAK